MFYFALHESKTSARYDTHDMTINFTSNGSPNITFLVKKYICFNMERNNRYLHLIFLEPYQPVSKAMHRSIENQRRRYLLPSKVE